MGYTFDLRTSELKAERVANPNTGTEHRFVAYRLVDQASKPVSMIAGVPVLDENNRADEE